VAARASAATLVWPRAGAWTGLLNLSFYLQVAAISRQNALGVVLSNGIDCTIRKP
jgi:hypothetical protein